MVGKASFGGSSSNRSSVPRTAKSNVKRESSSSPGANDTPSTKKQRKNGPDGDSTAKQLTAAITFGIEFELVLGFHETALNILKEEGIILDIIKDHGHNKQYDLLSHELKEKNRAFTSRNLWPSWLLKVPDDDAAISNDAVRGTSQLEFDGTYVRRYVMEPLLLVRQALATAGLKNVQVIGWTDKAHTRWHCSTCEATKGKDISPDHYTTKFGNYENDVLLRSMEVNYDKWTLTNDYTIVPVRRFELETRLVERGIRGAGKSWDSYGLELITRIMRFDRLKESFDEIENYLFALKAKQHVDVLKSVWATAHVHIGFDAETKADLSHHFFQHVAFILLSYERLITLCFPRRCSGAVVSSPVVSEAPIDMGGEVLADPADASDPEPEEPLTEAEEAAQELIDRAAAIDADDETVKKMEGEYTGDDDVRSNYDSVRGCLADKDKKAQSEITWHDMRDAIFTEQDNMVQLMRWMQKPSDDRDSDGQRHRGYMVNWCNIYTIWTDIAGFKNFKPTLEFRQHPCTTDAAEIKHWVLLLQAVMALARKMVLADTKYGLSQALDEDGKFAEREGSKYPHDGLPFGDVKAYVTQLLGLSESEGLYWENRYENFKNDRPM